jgi:hypothetical protein
MLEADMGQRGWSALVRKRADAAHAHKKRVRQQKQYLRRIKSKAELRLIVLGSRHLRGD